MKGLLNTKLASHLLILAVAALAGCATSAEVQSGDAQPSGSLIIYAARNEELAGPLVAQFRESAGIDVQVKYGETSELVTLLSEEGGNSPADVFYSRDPIGLAAVSHLLAPLPGDILSMAPEWARAPDGRWVGASARARVVVYNTQRLSEADLPDSIEGFTDARWKGRIGWSPTSGPTQTMITAMRVLWGEERARAWLEGIKANDPIYYPNHTAAVAGVGAGEADAAFVNHYYLLRFLQESGDAFPARNYHLRGGGPGNLVMLSGAGILSTSRNRANAERFLRFLLSKESQEYLTAQALDYPIADGVAPNTLLKPLSEINRPDIDQSLLNDIKGTEALMRDVGVIP